VLKIYVTYLKEYCQFHHSYFELSLVDSPAQDSGVGELGNMWLDLYACCCCQRRALHIARVPANPNCSGVVGSSTLPMIGRMLWISWFSTWSLKTGSELWPWVLHRHRAHFGYALALCAFLVRVIEVAAACLLW